MSMGTLVSNDRRGRQLKQPLITAMNAESHRGNVWKNINAGATRGRGVKYGCFPVKTGDLTGMDFLKSTVSSSSVHKVRKLN